MDDRDKRFVQETNAKFGEDAEGLWQVFGADDNCDLGGHHYTPSLGFYRGKLKDVIKLFMTLPRFWSWSVGEIKRVTVLDVDEGTADRLQELREKEKILEGQLSEVRAKLQRF